MTLIWRRVSIQGLLFIAGGLGILVTPNTAECAIRFWRDNAGNGNWNDATKWSSSSAADTNPTNNGAPALSDLVRIVNTTGTPDTVTLNASTPTLGLFAIDFAGAGMTPNTLNLTTNNTLTAGGINVGGYSGTAETSGRGAIVQSNGTISTTSGLDLVVAVGAGSTGSYSLSGTGAVVANQSLYIGYKGNGTFTQEGGTTTLNASAVGSLAIGILPSSTSTYNLSGGSLTANTFEYVGDQGVGTFIHSGGTNTIVGAGKGLTLGYSAGGNGTYTASGNASLVVPGDITVGLNGTGTLNIQGNASVHIGDQLNIGAGDTLNMSGGTLRLNTLSRAAGGILNYTSGTIKLAGNRVMGADATITEFFHNDADIPANQALVIEGGLDINGNANVIGGSLEVGPGSFSLRVGELNDSNFSISNGGTVTSQVAYIGSVNSSASATLNVDGPASSLTTAFHFRLAPRGNGTLNITNGGTLTTTTTAILGDQLPGNFTANLSGAGSKWMIGDGVLVGGNGAGIVNIQSGALMHVGSNMVINSTSTVNLNGGTLRFSSIAGANRLNFNHGTIQLAGNRTVGADANISSLFGAFAVVPLAKALVVEGTSTIASSSSLTIAGGTFKSNGLTVASGGIFDFDRGVFELTGGVITGLANLTVPTNGEFRASGVQSVRVTGTAGSTITATGALTLGDVAVVNGFGTLGTLNVGANTVTLLDANDVVFDSLALASLGNGASPGTLVAANGLSLDFGGNIAGFGTIGTPNNIAKPLINNGHITGNSPGQRITLPGYVKGVGTFDNVNFTGTFSPGLSPTILSVGNVALSPTSTLIMELGGATPGSGYDQIQPSGNLTFDGTLLVSLVNGFVPVVGQEFKLFDSVSHIGTFDMLQLPTLQGTTWDTSQLYSAGILSVAAAGILGDYNQNVVVDAADYTVWRNLLGSATSLPNDDTPGVGPDDYDRWRTHFGQAAGSGSVATANAAVPEPSSLVLMMLTAAGWCLRRRRAA